MTNPSIEIPERIKGFAVYITSNKDYYSPQAIALAEFLDQFIEKPIEAEPFVVYEVKVAGREERFLGFKSPISAVEWTVAPYEFCGNKPEYLLDNLNPSFERDSQVKVIRRIIPELEFGIEDKEFNFGDEVLVKAKLSSSEIDSDGDILVELRDAGYAHSDAKNVALLKEV